MGKKIFFIILFLFLHSLSLFSWVIEKRDAEQVAHKWILLENKMKDLRLVKEDLLFKKAFELQFEGEVVGYIAELEPKGFMIISMLTELSPIKFISFSADYGQIKNHPLICAITEELFQTCLVLGYRLKAPRNIYDSIMIDFGQACLNQISWNQIIRSDYQGDTRDTVNQAIPPLLASQWDQLYPYNAYTPIIDAAHCPTGCSTTAQAQVMYYWKYPKIGRGSNSYSWTWNDIKYSASADFNHEYFWDRMLNMHSETDTPNQIDAIARLMSDVGISNEVEYGPDGTRGGYNHNNSMPKFFKYSSDIKEVDAMNSSATDNFNTAKSQLDNKWPILASIFKPEAGHAVVFDGYRIISQMNQVHVNMGWGGSYDNYYSIDNISDFHTFFMTINIHPSQLPSLSINATRNWEQAVIIRKYFGDISINVSNQDFINYPNLKLLRKEATGGFHEIQAFNCTQSTNEKYSYFDKYLDKNIAYTYKVILFDADGNAAAESSEATISL